MKDEQAHGIRLLRGVTGTEGTHKLSVVVGAEAHLVTPEAGTCSALQQKGCLAGRQEYLHVLQADVANALVQPLPVRAEFIDPDNGWPNRSHRQARLAVTYNLRWVARPIRTRKQPA